MSSDTTQISAETAEASAAKRLRSPVYIATIDIAEQVADLQCVRPQEPPYTGAWILVLNSGYPVGCIEIPLRGKVISAVEIMHEVSRQLGQVASPAPSAAVALPKISIVVPTNFGRPEQLARSVQRLVALDYPDYEVIVVDNRRVDGPSADFPGARVVRERVPGISAARNRGIEVATGEVIAFTDDDVVADRGWLRALGSRFASEPDVDAVSGLVVPLELETPAQVLFEQSGMGVDKGFTPLTFARHGRFMVSRREQWTVSERVGSLYATGEFGQGSNMAFRTAFLRERGGFDEALGTGTPTRGGEDLAMLVELLMSGRRLAYEPGAIIHHSHRATMEELERQIHGYGIGFTAMLTAIALRNPWHLVGLASVVPAWLRSLRGESSVKQAGRSGDYPPSLARAELRGMLAGPAAYLHSRWIHRRRQRPDESAGTTHAVAASG